MKKGIFTLLVIIGITCFPFDPSFAESIVNSKHNLSSGGPGQVRAVTESEICIFCHTPHSATQAAPLWNRYDSGEVYTPYTSTTAIATPGQPTGATKLCLSCHDGTVAPGMVRSRSEIIPFTQPIGGGQNLGTDLSDDHPVSFHYDASLASQNPELKNPSSLTGPVQLDQNNELQCTTCHDPHNNQYGNFLQADGIAGGLCNQCHAMEGWSECVHNTSYTWNGVAPDPWPNTEWNDVRENACQNCHQPHNAGSPERLLNYTGEEEVCLPCHNGNAALKNVMSEFNKSSVHPIATTHGIHDPTEQTLVSANRHVECADCHNPHAATWLNWYPDLSGDSRFVKGISINGTEVEHITYQYELCFRCHADTNSGQAYVNRQYPETNTRIEFDPTNLSYHPIASIGKNPNVPSLIQGEWTTTSIMRCTHCHNNNSLLPSSPSGPHGSIYTPILERNLSFADNQPESLSTYALCYKCHDRNNILEDRSFSKHKRHIVDERSPCTSCHDPHGVKNATHLISFDSNIVSANASGIISFTDNGTFRGSCSLRCHNKEHNRRSY